MDDLPYLATNRDQCLQVLRFWHKIEFFVPFDLDDATSRSEDCLDLSLDMLQNAEIAKRCLPWLKPTPYHYQLFLLPFDKKALTYLSNRHFPHEFKQQNCIELEEKLDDEGLTCFARLFIDKHGCPQLNKMALSTLPWAMGMLQSDDMAGLSEQTYEKDMILLKSALNMIEQKYDSSKTDSTPNGSFNASLLYDLLKTLCLWARYSPDYPFVIKIKPIKAMESAQPDNKVKAIAANLPALADAVGNNETDEDDELVETEEQLDILNSFYIQDLEKCIRHLTNNEHPLLEFYINGFDNKQDLLQHENLPNLLSLIAPTNAKLGRWPASVKNMLSLMQQVSINQCLQEISITATNGPPGKKQHKPKNTIASLIN